MNQRWIIPVNGSTAWIEKHCPRDAWHAMYSIARWGRHCYGAGSASMICIYTGDTVNGVTPRVAHITYRIAV